MSHERQRMTVDEIELNADNQRVAVLIGDDGSQLVMPLSLLPAWKQEGDVLKLSLALDSDETERRRQRVKGLQKKLFGDR